MSDQHKFLLDESKLPKAWYNINADLPVPPMQGASINAGSIAFIALA